MGAGAAGLVGAAAGASPAVCARWAANTARFFGLPQVQRGITPLGVSNNWEAEQRLALDDPGVIQSLHSTPLADWDDRVPNRNMLRCELNGELDATLLCSDPHHQRAWPEIVYQGRDRCSDLH